MFGVGSFWRSWGRTSAITLSQLLVVATIFWCSLSLQSLLPSSHGVPSSSHSHRCSFVGLNTSLSPISTWGQWVPRTQAPCLFSGPHCIAFVLHSARDKAFKNCRMGAWTGEQINWIEARMRKAYMGNRGTHDRPTVRNREETVIDSD